MPVRVVHPVRVRVDATLLDPARVDLLADAVEAGVARAVATSRGRVLDALPDGIRIAVRAPEARWEGAPAADLTADERATVEKVVAAAIGRAMAVAGVSDGVLRRARPAPPGPVAEAADRGRLSTPLGRYVVPSYRGGRDTAIAIRDQVAAPSATASLVRWAALPADAYLARFWPALSEREHLWPRSGLLGALFRLPDGAYGVGAVRFPEQEALPAFVFGHRRLPQFGDLAGEGEQLRLDPHQVHHLTWWGRGADAASIIPAYYRAAWLAQARRMLPPLPGQDGADHEQALADAVDDELRERVAESASATAFLLLTAPGHSSLIHMAGQPDWVREGLDVMLIPLADSVTVRPPVDEPDDPDDEPEPGTGGDQSPDGPPDAGDEAGSPAWCPPDQDDDLPEPAGPHRWPETDQRGGVPFCTPFRDEPPAATVDGGDRLLTSIAALADRLEIARCEYAGGFALAAANAIAVRARDVGLRALHSGVATRVTVRADGGGNHGYLDIRPGESDDLTDLRRLAGIGADLHRFGDTLQLTYAMPGNRDRLRVSPEGAPNPSGWTRDFLSEFGDALADAQERVFAEACRVLLLQQLRSSAAGIAGRLADFPATLRTFQERLDVLGHRVVELQVLRRALENAVRTGARGTVRLVLAATVARPVGEGTEPGATGEGVPPVEPAPVEGNLPTPTLLDDVPEPVLRAVGDLPVSTGPDGAPRVLYLGQLMGRADLDRELDRRRSVLNRTDPLFLQFGDLEELVGPPDHVERALRRMLDQMRAANDEMTRQARQTDGAFFAVQVSQYVRRTGGRDERGLAYTLEGIHEMADRRLRPAVHGDLLYAEGVNRALNRQADRDALFGLAATAGIIVLGLLCAPLGATVAGAVTSLAGVGLAVRDVVEAEEHAEQYRAFEDPEQLRHWQDIQVERLTATLGLYLSVFFVAKDAAAVGATAAELVAAARLAPVAVEQGAGIVATQQATRRTAVRRLTRAVLEKAVHQAIHEAVVLQVMDALLPLVITPALLDWAQDQARRHGTLGEPETEQALQALRGASR